MHRRSSIAPCSIARHPTLPRPSSLPPPPPPPRLRFRLPSSSNQPPPLPFLSFLPSFSRVSLRVSLLPRPTVLSVYRAGVGSAARLALSFSLSLFLGYTGCAFLFPPRKLFDALTRPPPVTMRILLLDRSSLEGFHGIRRWKNRSFGGWGRSIDEKGKEATRSIVKHDCVTRLAAPFYREDERKVEARSVARALFRSYRSIYRIFSTNRRRGIRDFVRSKYRK